MTDTGTDTAAETAADVVRAAFRTGHAHLVEAIADVRKNKPDAVHQVRVAARGLRSDLRVYRDLLDRAWVGQLRAELSWLADSCGAARDLEVVGEWIDGLEDDPGLPLDPAAVAEVRAALLARQHAGESTALKATRSRRAQHLLDAVAEAARSAPFSNLADRSAESVLKPLVVKAWRRYAKGARRLVVDEDRVRFGHDVRDDDGADKPDDDPSRDAAWHEARVAAKRARYAARSASVVLDASRVEKAAKKAQTQLGHHQDRVVAAMILAEVGADAATTSAAFAAGRLTEVARQQRAAIRASFKRPKKRPPGLRGTS